MKQISVFLENRPGTLKQMTAALAEHEIDIRALSLAETSDFGIARLIVDDAYSAVNTLKEDDFIASLTSVLIVEIPDVPGGLDKLLAVFEDAKVNIEYMYASLAGKKSDHAYMIFRVEEVQKAEIALRAGGFLLANQDDISDM